MEARNIEQLETLLQKIDHIVPEKEYPTLSRNIRRAFLKESYLDGWNDRDEQKDRPRPKMTVI